MNTAEPIRNSEELERFKRYYLDEKRNPRNHLLIILGLNTALRISDMLMLQWQDIYNFETHRFCSHIILMEQKTEKKSVIFINKNLADSLQDYLDSQGGDGKVRKEMFLFQGRFGAALSRTQAWRIVRNAADVCGISGVISPHSLRKTFGYQAWKKGVSPVMLMSVFNHSSFEITKRYLGITQEDRDHVFRDTCI